MHPNKLHYHAPSSTQAVLGIIRGYTGGDYNRQKSFIVFANGSTVQVTYENWKELKAAGFSVLTSVSF